MRHSDMNMPARRTGQRHRRSQGPTLVDCVFAALLTLFLCVGSAAHAADNSSRHFEIKAMPLAQALVAFGVQSGLTVVAPTTLTAGKTATPVSGDLAPTDALTQLLKGSGLTFARAADGTITIQAIGTSEAAPPNAGESSPARVSTQDQNQLGEVIVTAQRRSEALIKVAAPVSALLASDLQRNSDVRLADYAASVPGLNLISEQAGENVIVIRGVSTGLGFASSSTTATYIDDTPFGSSTANALGSVTAVDLDPATLQRVEVLRGPQGTLYGASAMGGLIKYVTIPPSLTKDSGRVELDGDAIDGGGQGWGVRAMWTGPLVADKLGMTINAYDRHDPGYIDDPNLDRKNVNSAQVDGGRVAFLWKPIDDLSAEFSAMTQDSTTDGSSEVDVNSDLTPIYGKYQQFRHAGVNDGHESWDIRATLASLRVVYDLHWASLTSISSYQSQTANTWIDFTFRFGPLLESILNIPNTNLGVFDHVTLDDHRITQEIRLASPGSDRFEWLGGLYFTHEKSVQPERFSDPFNLATNATVPVPGGIFTDPNNDRYWEYAGYADLTYHFTSKFQVLAGARFTHDAEDNVTPFSGLLNGPPAVAMIDTSSSTTTYLFSPSYNLDDNNMIYIRVASGFRPGGPTGLTTTSVYAGAPASYGPDTLTNYEIGYKAGLPERRMTIDVSAFDIEWKKMQVLSETPSGFIVTGNAGNARSSGLEMAWAWRPLAGLTLAANAAYTDAHLTSDSPGISAKAGDRLPDVPKLSANLSADYDFPISDEISGFAGGNYQYQGARIMDFVSGAPPNFVRPAMPSYNTVNLRAGLIRGGFTGELYVKNAGNSYGINHLVSEVQDGYSAPLGASVLQPRTFGVSLSYKF